MQSFLVAGSNAVAATLWSVSDAGTALFMSEVYDRVYNKGASFAEAMNTTRIDFIAGKYGEKMAMPMIWAPFVYYGR
jgi:CHAT domain-containing protein